MNALRLAPLLAASGCLGSFHTPSAYQEQPYLCDAAHAGDLGAKLEVCKATPGCGGVFSMTGSMQGQPLTVTSQLSGADYVIVEPPGMATQTLDQINITGESPYFVFIFHTKSMGGDLTMASTTPRTLAFNGGATGLAMGLDDDQVDVGQLLEVSGASSEQHGQTASGQIVVNALSISELDATFSGAFGDPNDKVDGCFRELPLTLTINPAPSP
jgi:hypothetical protein